MFNRVRERSFCIRATGARRRFASTALRSLIVAALCVAALPRFADAQTLPPSIRFIVPFSPGGVVDLAARLLAEEMQKDTGTIFVVENRPGANGALAARAVKQADPDGRNLLFTSSSVITISPILSKDAGYDPLTDFAPVTIAAYTDVVLVVGSKVKANTLKGFIEEAKASSKPLAIGSAGFGNTTHGYLELLKQGTGLQLTHVPYRGGAPALIDVLSGNVDGAVVALNVAISHLKAGTIRALALVGDKRSQTIPEVPTFAEMGVPELNILTWLGLMAPMGTPGPVVDALAEAVAKALKSDSVRSKFSDNGVVPLSMSPQEFRAAITTESELWKKAF